jgi:hypothetical protein
MEGYKKMPRSGIAHMQTKGVSTAPIKRSAPKSAAKAKGYKKGGAVKKAGGGLALLPPAFGKGKAGDDESAAPGKPSAAARRKAMKLKPKVKPKLDVMIAIGKGKKEGGKVKKYADGGAIEAQGGGGIQDLIARRQASQGPIPPPAAPAPQAPPPPAAFGDATRQMGAQFPQQGGDEGIDLGRDRGRRIGRGLGLKDGGKVDCKKEGGVVKKKSSAMPVSGVEDTGFKSMTKMKSSMSGKSAATGHVQKLATGGRVARLAEGGQYQYEKDPAESADAFNKRMATATMATDTYKKQNDPAEVAKAKAWRDEFFRLNNMPVKGAKSDPVGDMQYWQKIVANQQSKLNDPNQGYRLPGNTNIRLPHAMEAGGTAPYISLAQAQEMAKTNPEIAALIARQLPTSADPYRDAAYQTQMKNTPASTNLDLAKDIRQYAGGAGPSKDPWTFADQGQGADTGSAATPSGPSMEGFLKLINDRRATRNMPPLTSLSPTPDASQPPPATTQPPPASTTPPATQTPPGTGQPPPNGGYGGYDWYGQNNGSYGGFSGGPIGFLDRPNKYVPNQARVSGGQLVQNAGGQWVPQQAATAQTVPAQKKGGRVRSRAR